MWKYSAVLLAALIGTNSAIAADTAPTDVKINEGEISSSLTGKAGDPASGREWYAGRKLGNCLACHQTTDLKELPFHGEVGPPMDGVADRYEVAELRAILVNSKEVLGDETIMPGFYTFKAGVRVADKFQNKTILQAQQVEDIIAYLKTLKE
ncbi:MAG: sulfur oxidation c-type cytochrome SoxX [Rhizobiaceae bacterium]|nr:sulfur oxidation c-type cytochrome SoxX [Rhizobiaceae bacterium]